MTKFSRTLFKKEYITIYAMFLKKEQRGLDFYKTHREIFYLITDSKITAISGVVNFELRRFLDN